jgi:hypothetical protein
MESSTLADYVGRSHQREEIPMSVVVSVVAPGFNAEIYEAVTEKVMPGDQLPDQCHLHIAGPVEQGWRVITVWSSREDFDRFRDEKLLPAIQELGGDAAPPAVEPEVHEVHKLVTS